MRHSHSLIAAALITLSSATVARAFDVDAERPAMRAALEAAERGPFDLATQPRLRKHPLWPWLEATALGRDLASTSNAQAQDFLQRFDGQPAAENFRGRWLGELARRNDWTGFMASWKPRNDTALRCQQLRAREALGQANAQWDNDAQAIWRNGKSLPDACDPVFASLDVRGGLTPALRWERIGLAIEDVQPGVIRAIARGLPPTEAAQATAYAAFLDAPGANVTGWPRDARSRRVATVGLAQLARRDPGAAENALPAVTAALQLDDAARNQVLAEIAVWSAANSLPEAPHRFAAIPATAYDERLHEWRAREAMMRADWPAALTAIRAMAPAQRSDPRWRWFEARLVEKTGDSAGARALYAQVATSPTFHGFLAADKLGQSYALCPLAPHDSAQAKHQVARDPGIVRATELWKLQRKAWANQEWNAALARFNADQRRIAVEVAQDNEWFDRAVFALREADELRLYKLRFPIHHKRRISHEAEKRGIDPAWVAAEIRAESLFDPTARSSADARGLMQVLPSTGAAVAKRIGLDWKGGDTLYDPDDNIAIGTAYLRETLDRHGQTYLAIAAYNAGAAPVNRWLAARPDFDPDFWIETIGYKETREYVARVLAFSVIYDWRMEGDALPVSERLRGNFGGKRKGFACPAP